VPETAGSEATVRRAFQIYLYAVCFVTIVVVLFAGSQAIYALVRVAAPATTAPSSGESRLILRGGGSGPFDYPASGRSTADTRTERNEGKLQLIQNGILLVLALGIFLFHWTRASKLRAELERSTAASEYAPMQPEPPPAV
jgi:hypothetical protein